MSIIATNLITIVLLVSTIILLTLKTRLHTPKSASQYQLIFSFFILIIGTSADTLFHLDFGVSFDVYGEYINLMFFPLFIFSIFTYSLNKELEKRKQSEKQLQHQNEEYLNLNKELLEGNNEILKVNMELDSFVYRVSHDLRAPICTAMGLTNISKESDDIEEIKKYLTLQETSLKRLDQFIKDILDHSKNIHTELIPEIIDFNQLIDTAFHDYQSTDIKNIKFIKKLDTTTPFSNDLLRMKIIFNNLISNAIKFQKEREPNKLIEIYVHTSPEKAVITIRDNGMGIKEEFKKDVFKIFFRATNKNYGSGLGLYIVNDCVKKINGSMELISNYDEGTTIKIEIPNTQRTLTIN